METSRYSLEGTDELIKAMKALPADLQSRILKGFLRKAGNKFIVNPLKAKLPYSQESKNSIKVIAGNKNETSISAGVSSKGYYLRWADLGTKERTKGHNRGKILGKNQIQPHIESQVEPLVNYVNEELGTEIQKTLERRLKKLRKK